MSPTETAADNSEGRINVPVVAIAEAALGAIAFLLAWLGLRNPNHPLFEITSFAHAFWVICLAAMGTLPLLALLILLDRAPGDFFEKIRRDTSHLVQRLFNHLTIVEMAIISLLAGYCEELLFRWSLQDGLAYRIGDPHGWWIAWFAVSALFGLAHFVNWTYCILAGFIGLWLGGLMLFCGTWLVPAIAHSFYDFVALCYLANRIPGLRRTPQPGSGGIEF